MSVRTYFSKYATIVADCIRCGQEVTTTSRALRGYTKLGIPFPLCQSCVTPEEHQKILEYQGQEIVKP